MDILVSKQINKYMILTETKLTKTQFKAILELSLGYSIDCIQDVDLAFHKLCEIRQGNGLKIDELPQFFNKQ